MAEPILLLRLEAPMQSWGTRSRWDVRDSGPEPTKSGVVGLLGAALGLLRGDRRLEELDGALRFAVRADRPGRMATDYHTVTGRHRMANGKLKGEDYTVQSYRDYLHDAAFLVALAGEAALLEEMAGALARPRWPLFLGRKSCVPTRPVLDDPREPVSDRYDGLEHALRRAFWAAPPDRGARRRASAEPPVLSGWVEVRPGEADYERTQERQDAMRTNALRFYDFRRALRIEIPTVELEGCLL